MLRPGGRLLIDYLRPDDFRCALGRSIGENYCESPPWLPGVTDFFCEGPELEAWCAPLRKVREGDLSANTPAGERISQGFLWLERLRSSESSTADNAPRPASSRHR